MGVVGLAVLLVAGLGWWGFGRTAGAGTASREPSSGVSNPAVAGAKGGFFRDLKVRAGQWWGERVQELDRKQGLTPDPDHPDTQRRFEMGVFPVGAGIVPNPYNRIPGFFVGKVYFVPGFPVMAHPMMAWALDRHAELHRPVERRELSFIVQGAMEASLTPLMEAVEQAHPGIKVFSLPSVDHPQWGRCIELGVKGAAERLDPAYAALKQGVIQFGATISTELVR